MNYRIKTKTKRYKITCPNCEGVFFRTKEELSHSLRCPSCHMFIQKQHYAHPADWPELSTEAKTIQRALGKKRVKRVRMMTVAERKGAGIGKSAGFVNVSRASAPIRILPQGIHKVVMGGEPIRKTLTHEIAHTLRPSSGKFISGHGPVFKSVRRYVDRVAKTVGSMKRLRRLGFEMTKGSQMEYAGLEKEAAKKIVKPTLERLLTTKLGAFGKRHAALLALISASPILLNRLRSSIADIEGRRAQKNYLLGSLTAKAASKIHRVKALKLLRKKWKRQLPSRRLTRGAVRFPAKHPKTTMVVGGIGLGAGLNRSLNQRRERSTGRYQLPFDDTPIYIPKELLRTKLRRGLRKSMRGFGGDISRTGKIVGKTAVTAAIGGAFALTIAELLEWLRRKGGVYIPDVRPDIELAPRYMNREVIAQYAAPLNSKLLMQFRSKVSSMLQQTKNLAAKNLLVWLLGFTSAEMLGRGLTTPKKQLIHTGAVPTRKGQYARLLRIKAPLKRVARKSRLWFGGRPLRADVRAAMSKRRTNLPDAKTLHPQIWEDIAEGSPAGTKAALHLKGIKMAQRKRLKREATKITRGKRRSRIATAGVLSTAAIAPVKVKESNEYAYLPAIAKAGPLLKKAAGVAGKWGNRAFTGWFAWDVMRSLKKPRTPRQSLRLPQQGGSRPGSVMRTPAMQRFAFRLRYPWRTRNLLTLMSENARQLATKATGAYLAPKTLKPGVADAIRHRSKLWKNAERELEMIAKQSQRKTAAAVAAGTAAGVGGYVAGKKRENRRIRKMIAKEL